MSNHTPEPWVWEPPAPVYVEGHTPVGENMGGFATESGRLVMHFGTYVPYADECGRPPSEPDRERMLACIRALAGIADPAAFVAAAKEARERLKVGVRMAKTYIKSERYEDAASVLESLVELGEVK